MFEDETHIFRGVAPDEEVSIFTLARERIELTSRLHFYALAAADIAEQPDAPIFDLQEKLELSLHFSDELSTNIADSIAIMLHNHPDGTSIEQTFQAIASMLGDSRHSQINVYRDALGLETIAPHSSYETYILRLCEEYKNAYGTIDGLHSELVCRYNGDCEERFAKFIESSLTTNIDYWEYEEWEWDIDDGNG